MAYFKDTDLIQGPVPEQWKPENQNPQVAYVVDEVTGNLTPLDVPAPVVEEPKPKATRAKKAPKVEEPVEAVEEPAVEEPAVEEPATEE